MLITDQNMPKMTGLELIRLLRRERPDLPTLLLSGHSNVVNRHNCKDLGVGELVEKPFDVMELTRNVMNTLSANRHH
jgi:CheY-like chemotaxis protein